MTKMDENGKNLNDRPFVNSHGGKTPFYESEWGKNSEFSYSEIYRESDSKEHEQVKQKQSGISSRFSHPYVGGQFLKEHFGIGSDSWGPVNAKLSKPSDSQLYENICHALYLSPLVDATHIEVYIQDGVVKMTGFVRDRTMKKNAELCIENLPGLKDVMNELQLQS
jgi:hypothetical protein